MKKLIFSVVIPILLGVGCATKKESMPISHYSVDTALVFKPIHPNSPLTANDVLTYGPDSITAISVNSLIPSDNPTVYISLDLTLLDLDPIIMSNLFDFVRNQSIVNGFVSIEDTISYPDIISLTSEKTSQKDIAELFCSWEKEGFIDHIMQIKDNIVNGYNIGFEIYPVYLDKDYVTYRQYAYWYTGGANGNSVCSLVTFSRTTGERMTADDFILPDKIDDVRCLLAKHMAESYPIYSDITTVEQYLDSLNAWLGNDNAENSRKTIPDTSSIITLSTFPMKNPGLDELGLVFIYDQYELAPGSDGCPVVVLTFDEMKGLLREPFDSFK